MENHSIQQKPYLPNYATKSNQKSGFTLTELLIAMGIAAVLLASAIGVVNSSRDVYNFDLAKTTTLGNLRTTMDLVGQEVKQAGQGLDTVPNFPVISLVKTGTNSEFTIIRSEVTSTVTICDALAAGTVSIITVGALVPVTGAPVPNCTMAGQQTSLNDWRTYLTKKSNLVGAFIFDPTAGTGDFLNLTNITTSATSVNLNVSGTLSRAYTLAQAPIIYLVETRKYTLDTTSKILQLQRDNSATKENMTPNISRFSVSLCISPTANAACTTWSDATFAVSAAQPWKQVRLIRVTIASSEKVPNSSKTVDKEITNEFLPRNTF